MQKLAEICIRRPIFASMIILSLCVVGGVSYFQLGVDRFPPVDMPTVMVRASLPGAAPEEMESEVSIPLEEAINTVQGIEELRSISGAGTAIVVTTIFEPEFRSERLSSGTAGLSRIGQPSTCP